MRGHAKTVEAMKWMAQKLRRHQLLRARASRARRSVQPERQQRLQHRAPAQLQQRRARPWRSAWKRSRAMAPRMRAVNTPSIATTSAAPSATSTASAAPPGAAPASTRAQIGGVWDALLGEGRNWWFFASSDWHNRGMFGPDDRRSSQDFYPGEYQRTYVKVGEGKGRHFDSTKQGQGADAAMRSSMACAPATAGRPAASSSTAWPSWSARTRALNDAIGNVLMEAAAVVAAKQNTDVDIERQLRHARREARRAPGLGSGGGHRRARPVRR